MRLTVASLVMLASACLFYAAAASAGKNAPTATGTLEICKDAANGAAGQTFSFTVEKGTAAGTNVSVVGGNCGQALSEPAGTYKITENLSGTPWTMASATVIPSDALISTTAKSSLIKVSVTAGNETVVNVVNQQAATYFKVCKWSASTSLQGSQVSFAVGNQLVQTTTGKSAGAANCTMLMSMQAGTNLTVTEALPKGVNVANVTASSNANITSSNGGAVRVTLGAGVNSLTYEDEPVGPPQTGFLEICKDAGDEFISATTPFSFTVTDKNNSSQTVQVTAGQCSGPMTVAAGSVSVAEAPTPNTFVSGISTYPSASSLGLTNLTNGTAIVVVPVSATSTGEVQLHYVNSTLTAPLKVCKFLAAGSNDLAGQTFTFNVTGSVGQTFTVPIVASTSANGACKNVTYANANFPIGNRTPSASAQFPIGSTVTVTESLAKYPNVSGDGNPAGQDDTKQLTVANGINSINFTNQALGQLEICKNMQTAPTDDTAYNGTVFQFSIDGSSKLINVAAGKCSFPQVVTVGTHTVQEVNIPNGFQFVSSGASGPLGDNRATSTGNPITVTVPYFDAAIPGGGETDVTFVDKVQRAFFKVCKVIDPHSQAALGSLSYTFDYSTDTAPAITGSVTVPADTCSGLINGVGIPVIHADGTPTNITVTEEINGPFKTTSITVDNSAGTNADLVNHTVTYQAQVGIAAVTFTNAFATAGLTIKKDDNQTTAIPGTFVTYTITVTNNGPDYAYNLEVDDTLPSQGCNNDSSPNLPGGVTFNDSNPTIFTWTTAKLAPGKTLTLKLKCKIPAGATGQYADTATASASDSSPVMDSDTDTLTPQADLAVTKAIKNGPPVPGTTVTYTITVTNNGPSNVTGFHLVDNPVGPGLTPTANPWQNKSAFTPSSTAPTTEGDWAGTLAPGDNFSITWKGNIDPGQTGTVENDATATPTLPSGITDPDTSNNTFKDTENLAPTTALSVTKALNKGTPPVPGTSVTYTITVTNGGPSTLTGFSISDTPDANFTPNTSPWGAGSSGTFTAGTAGPPTWSGTVSGVSILPGKTYTITFKGKIAPGASGQLVNKVSVSSPTDPNSPETYTDSETLTPQVNLAVVKTGKPANAIPGNVEHYTIKVTNNGPSTITSVNVTDTTAPANACTFTQASGGDGTWTPTTAGGGTGTWSGLSLANGNTATLLLDCAIDPTITAASASDGNLTNNVDVEPPSGVTDTDETDNTSSVAKPITPKVNLAVVKTGKPASAVPGSVEHYTIKVTNNGPSTITSVNVTDTTAPAGACTFTQASGGDGTWTPTTTGGGTGTWSGLTLSNGATATLLLDCAIDPTITAASTNDGNLTNNVDVEPPSSASETDPSDNTSSVAKPITPKVNLAVKKTSKPTSAVPGNVEHYTIKVTNNGPSTITSVSVADTTNPAGACTFAQASGGDGTWTPTTTGGGTGTWSGLTLANNTSATLLLDCTIDPTITPGSTTDGNLTNTVKVEPPASAAETDDSDNSSSVANAIAPSVKVSINKDDGITSIKKSTADTYTITITNVNGPSALTSFTLSDPSPTDFFPTSPNPWAILSGGGTLSAASTTSVTWTATTPVPVGGTVKITFSGTSGTTTGSNAMQNSVSVTPPTGTTFTGTTTSNTDKDTVTT